MFGSFDWRMIIDIGSGITKAGRSEEDVPRCKIPSIVGRGRNNYALQPGLLYQKPLVRVGDEANKLRGILSLNFPVERGVISDWEDIEELFHFVFYSWLHAPPDEHAILLSEPPLNPKHNREKLTQVFFETFRVPELLICMQGYLSNMASGRGTAVMVEIGDDVTHVVPIYEGYCIQPGVRRIDFGGKDLTFALQKMLNEKGHSFATTAEFEILREIKESVCILKEPKDLHPMVVSYELPDGQLIKVGQERFDCVELLFKSDPDSGFGGIHNLLHDSLQSVDIDMRNDLYANITLSGGSTLFPGFADRLQKEISALVPDTMRVRVFSPDNRDYSVWLGGSVLGSLSRFSELAVSKVEYSEYGPDIVNRLVL